MTSPFAVISTVKPPPTFLKESRQRTSIKKAIIIVYCGEKMVFSANFWLLKESSAKNFHQKR
jgi:hypothetical protein